MVLRKQVRAKKAKLTQSTDLDKVIQVLRKPLCVPHGILAPAWKACFASFGTLPSKQGSGLAELLGIDPMVVWRDTVEQRARRLLTATDNNKDKDNDDDDDNDNEEQEEQEEGGDDNDNDDDDDDSDAKKGPDYVTMTVNIDNIVKPGVDVDGIIKILDQKLATFNGMTDAMQVCALKTAIIVCLFFSVSKINQVKTYHDKFARLLAGSSLVPLNASKLTCVGLESMPPSPRRQQPAAPYSWAVKTI